MTQPNYVVPGQVIACMRRTLERRFYLRPDRQMVQLFKYLLALYAQRYGIVIHAGSLMSTHYHLVFTDTLGRRGDFFRDFHHALTCCVQVYRGLDTYVVDKEPTSQPDVVTCTGIVEAVAYAIANPTLAGIVEDPSTWPGTLCQVAELGTKSETVHRPGTFRRESGHHVRYFDVKSGRWPPTVELRFEPVAAMEAEGTDLETYRRDVAKEVARLVHEKREENARENRRFTRLAKALRVRVERCSTTEEPRRRLRPRVKAGRGQDAARIAALARNARFQQRHEEARLRTLVGEEAIFPRGTYRWAHTFGFSVALHDT